MSQVKFNNEGTAQELAAINPDGISANALVSTDNNSQLTNPYWIGIMETADPGFGIGNLSVSKIEDGSAVMLSLENQSNTTDSNGRFDVRVAGASGGDPYINMDISGVGGWSFGVDNSDDDQFKIDRGGPPHPGSNTYFSITTDGAVNIGPSQTKNGIGKLSITGANASAAGPELEFYTAADAYPLVQIFPYTHDNITMLFDCYFDDTVTMTSSSENANFWISKDTGALNFGYSPGGFAQGTSLSGNELTAMFIDTSGNLNLNQSLKIAQGGSVDLGDLSAGLGVHALGVNVSSGGPGIELYNTAVDDYPMMQQYAASHDNLGICFDCYFDSSIVLTSSDAGSNFIINKFADQLQFNYAVGQAQGDNIFGALTLAMAIDTSGNLNCSSNLNIVTAGKTLKVKQGSNACSGTGEVMVAGTVTVSTTAVNSGDTVFISKTADGGTSTVGMPVITIVDGVSFTITGLATDTSTWSWWILKAL